MSLAPTSLPIRYLTLGLGSAWRVLPLTAHVCPRALLAHLPSSFVTACISFPSNLLPNLLIFFVLLSGGARCPYAPALLGAVSHIVSHGAERVQRVPDCGASG